MLRGALLLGVMAALLAGCGFHLRGSEPLPAVMTKSYLAVPYASPLHYELESLLLAAGGEVVETSGAATAILTVESANIRSRVLSLDTDGRAREYGLTLTVKYRLQAADGSTRSETLSSRVERDYRFNPDNVLGQSAERAQVERDMYRVAAQQMLRRLRHATMVPDAEPAPAQ